MKTSSLQRAVAPLIHQALPPEAGLDIESIAELLSPPPDRKLGDLAFPCFRLAKSLRMAPPKIAADLAGRLDPQGIVSEVTVAGPYLNFRLASREMALAVLPPWVQGIPKSESSPNVRVMVEYSQPNTHKAFHVGHMRNLSLGDALVRLLRADGYDVLAANYLGDVGAHIAKCLWWYLDHLEDRTPPATARGEWLGQVYADASNQLSDWEDRAKAGDQAAATALGQAKARITEILQKLESREPEITEVWRETREWSLDEFNEIYAWSKVTFDRVYYESEVDEPGLALVQEYLDKGVFVESDGAVGIYNEEVKHMPFFMLRKRDGTSLYATKDLALAKLKFEDCAIDRSIYVVDTRQSDHFRHVFLTLKRMGYAQAEQCEHVPYEMVELPSGAMATRRGNVILFRALREQMLAHIESEYLAKYRGEWSDEEIDDVAHALALGAIKYGMLNRDVNQKIVFDMEAWLNLEGNTGPYIQYSAARFGSILRKAKEQGFELHQATLDHPDQIVGYLEQPEERDLIATLDELHPTIHQAAQQLRPSIVCTYLHTLAKAVHRFGTSRNCRVLQSEGELQQARLYLVTSTYHALTWGLEQLGIPAPSRM